MKKTISILILFAIAMGFMESAIVIYLREIYYPSGFRFPLIPIPGRMANVEVLREAATVIMLLCTGYLAGKSSLQRFAYFVLAFAIWDLFYYVFLFLFIQWPQSLFTWDILFLIPFPWVGPVWAPCLLCLLMIIGSIHFINRTAEDPLLKIKKAHWLLMIVGACICILSFMWDYLRIMTARAGSTDFFSQQDLFEDLKNYVPVSFNSCLFFTGFALMCASIILSCYRSNKT